jgi:hypothetical protein
MIFSKTGIHFSGPGLAGERYWGTAVNKAHSLLAQLTTRLENFGKSGHRFSSQNAITQKLRLFSDFFESGNGLDWQTGSISR